MEKNSKCRSSKLIAKFNFDEEIVLKILRKGEIKEIKVKSGERK